MLNLGGVGLIAFLMLHMIFGAIVGAMYALVVHAREGKAVPRFAH